MAEKSKPKTAAAEAIRKTAGGVAQPPPEVDQFNSIAATLERLHAVFEKIQAIASIIRNVFAEINALSARTADSIEQLSANFEHVDRSITFFHEGLSAGRAALKSYISVIDSLSSSVDNLNKKVRELHGSLGKFGGPPYPQGGGGGSAGGPRGPSAPGGGSGGPPPAGGIGRVASDTEATGASSRSRSTRRTKSAATDDDETIEHAHIRYYRRSGVASDERRKAVDDLLKRARSVAPPPVSRSLVSKPTPRQREARSRLWSTIGTLGAVGASIVLPPLLSAFSVSPAVISAVVGAIGANWIHLFASRDVSRGGVIAWRISESDLDDDDIKNLSIATQEELGEELEEDTSTALRKRRRQEAFALEGKIAPRLHQHPISLDAHRKLSRSLSKHIKDVPYPVEVPPPESQSQIRKLPKTLFKYDATEKPIWQWTVEDEKQYLPAQMSPFVTYHMSRLFPWAPLTPRKSEWTEAQSRGYSFLSSLVPKIAERKKNALRIIHVIHESRAALVESLEAVGHSGLLRVIREAGIGPELLLGLAHLEKWYREFPRKDEKVQYQLATIDKDARCHL